MAFTKVRTALALNRYARIMGINPLHMSGGNEIELSDGSKLFPINNAQNNIWPQFAWQNTDMVSRDDLAYSILQSETEISQFIGTLLTPGWTVGEQAEIKLQYSRDGYTQGLQLAEPRYANFISGGQRQVTFIITPTITYKDVDGDGYQEIAEVKFANPSLPLEELKVYFMGKGGDPSFEIRNPVSKFVSGGFVYINFNSWEMIEVESLEFYPTDNSYAIDVTDPSNLAVKVDVYREYNDFSKSHVDIVSVDYSNGTETIQQGFLSRSVIHKNLVMWQPGEYTVGWSVVEAPFNCNADNVYLKLNYYSGIKQKNYITNVDDYLPDDIARAVAFMATARLDRLFASNNNAVALAEELRTDMTASSRERFIIVPPDVLNCPFGFRVGEYKAWKIVSSFVARVWKSATI